MSLKSSKVGGNEGEKKISKVKSDRHKEKSKAVQDKKVVGKDGKYSPKKSKESIKGNVQLSKYFIEACYHHLEKKY